MLKYRVHSGLFTWPITFLLFIGVFFTASCAAEQTAFKELQWPAPSAQNRPWSRWWWLGSAVDEQNLTDLLTQYQQAGIGGVEICPIYGVKGYEQQFKKFLSPEWVAVLEKTLREGDRLNIGVDLTLGTGWPFGGPMVTKETASSGVILKQCKLQGGKLAIPLPKESLQYLLAVSEEGGRIDVTDQVQQGQLVWDAPEGSWTVYAVAVKQPLQRVKRAAPGGEGYVLNPYSVEAMESYLGVFDNAFKDLNAPMPRTFFHDSFEYYHATWTPDFFAQFKKLRGYDLRDHIEALFGKGPDETVARVMCDYHETINDLHLDYIGRWTQWCNAKGSLSRNQAHGAPANLVDLYAAPNIPETEIFRHVDEAQVPMLKFSSSAAHLTGQVLSSSESFTWLKEHFQTSLGDLKHATDFLFLSGVNHIFFHGIPYSPKEAPWPGWQFYASVNFGPDGGLWHDLPAYNDYVTRCQSILQSGKPDNDILLYLPIYDLWHDKGKLHMTFTVHNQDEWLYPSAFHGTAMSLWKKGYTYDAVSDQFLAKASCQNSKISIGESEYAAVVVPQCRLMPEATMAKLIDLAQAGATVIFAESLPQDVPGLANLDARRGSLQGMLKSATTEGTIIVGDLKKSLQKALMPREHAMDAGIRFVRRRSEKGYDYFFVNRSSTPFDGWLTLSRNIKSAVCMDPLFEDRAGWAAVRNSSPSSQVYLQIQPGQSLILRTFTNKETAGPVWQYTRTLQAEVPVEGTWDVEFIDGGPTLPQGYQVRDLATWTERDDENVKRFHGTARYTIEFVGPEKQADGWMLDLGRVCHSARVKLNGEYLGALWAQPFKVQVGPCLVPGKNKLEIEVTNLAANRIRDLDRRKVNWKYFYDANVVNVNYKPFDASGWDLIDSGLLGPVVLRPQKSISIRDNN